jgi:uncharacterized Zn finger protein
MTTIPTITRQDIRTFVGEQNFQKGQQLAHDGAIINPEQQVMALKAYCYGSLPEPYRVQVAWLRKRHSRLSTLKQELVAAGL